MRTATKARWARRRQQKKTDYNIFGMAAPNTFTSNAAGQQAMKIANFFSAYIFPKASGDPLSPALSNRRQDNVFDTRNGYFQANPLGLWTAVFVSYTAAGLDPSNAVCAQALGVLRAKNGTGPRPSCGGSIGGTGAPGGGL